MPEAVARRRRRDRPQPGAAHPVNPYRPLDVLQRARANILEAGLDLAADVLVHPRRDANTAGIGQPFQPRRDIDAVAIDVVAVDDDIADIDADAEIDAAAGRNARIPVGHALLPFDRAAHRVDDAGEFDQQTVAGRLDDAAAMLGDLGVAQFAPDCFEPGERAFLVDAHEPRIARDIGRQDRRQFSLDPHSVHLA